MTKYNFLLDDYHAVGHAHLVIDGITVVAGVNGCGKSTISRWLYYVVNTMSAFDSLLFAVFRERIIKSFEKYSKVLDDMDAYVDEGKRKNFDYCLSLMPSVTFENGDIAKLNRYYERAVDLLDEMIASFLLHEQNPKQVRRVLNLFGVGDGKHFKEDIKKNANRVFSTLSQEYRKAKADRSKSFLIDRINSTYCEKDAFPQVIGFKEDDVDLLSDKVGKAYSLDNAVYIGTPTAISLRQSDKILLDDLKRKVNVPNADRAPADNAQTLLGIIGEMLNGSIVERENFDETELFYHSRQGLDIRLEDVASGFKPLAYLQRLIENGWFTETTLLEIDEPETNLHPQWVVELAHLLVLINKMLGTKVLVTSHNPDMVSAIKYISEKEGLAEKTHFYLAEPLEGSTQYEFKDLGNDIDPVFDSFNQSFGTLEKYATDFGKL